MMAEDMVDDGGKAVSFLVQAWLGRRSGAAEFFLLNLHLALLEVVGAVALDEKEKVFKALEIVFVVTASESEIESAAFEKVNGGGREVGLNVGSETIDLARGFGSLGRLVQNFASPGMGDVALQAGFRNGAAELFLGEFDRLAVGMEFNPLGELGELSIGKIGQGFDRTRLFHRVKGCKVGKRDGLSGLSESLPLFGW